MDWIAILMGWPSLAVALLLSIVGVVSRRPAWLWIAAVLITPMALYLSLAPAYPLIGLVPFAGLVTAAMACRQPRRWLSVTGVSLYGAFFLALASIVISESVHW